MHVVKCFIIKRKEKTLFHHTPAMTVSYVSTETRNIKLEAKKLKALYTYQMYYFRSSTQDKYFFKEILRLF